MMNETKSSFAMKSPANSRNLKKYESISQNDNEESQSISHIKHDDSHHLHQNHDHEQKQHHHKGHIHHHSNRMSASLGISVDENGIDKRDDSEISIQPLVQLNNEIDLKSIDDMNEQLNKELIPIDDITLDIDIKEHEVHDDMDDNIHSSLHSDPDIMDDGMESSASSYAMNVDINHKNNDSSDTYNSFKIDDREDDRDTLMNDKPNNISLFDEMDGGLSLLSTPSNYINNEIIFWLFTLKKMKIIVISIFYKKFLQTIMALNMVTVIIYIAFIYEYNVDFMQAISNANKYEILFSLLINSNIVQAIIILIEYYSSALRMNYNGFVYPVFIGICYSIMSVIFSVSQFDLEHTPSTSTSSANNDTDEENIAYGKIEIDNLLNVSIGKIYLSICCDWIGNPLHALLHSLSIILVLVVFHALFTFTKNIILSHIWSYHNKHHHNEMDEEDKDIAMNVVNSLRKSETNRSDHNIENRENRGGSIGYNIVNDGANIKIIPNDKIKCDINMDNIEESSIVLDASVSQISSSIVELAYDPHKYKNIRNRIMSASEHDIRMQNLPILEEDDMVNDIVRTPNDDESYVCYNEKEGDFH